MKSLGKKAMAEPAREYGMCEPALKDQARGWNATKRRAMARMYERRAAQLILSAELMEKSGLSLNEPAEIVFPDVTLQEQLSGKTPAECLELATDLGNWSDQIITLLGLQKPKVLAPERLSIVWPN
jgi:hypothetical protein